MQVFTQLVVPVPTAKGEKKQNATSTQNNKKTSTRPRAMPFGNVTLQYDTKFIVRMTGNVTGVTEVRNEILGLVTERRH